MLGPSWLQGFCSNANIHCSSSSKLLCTMHWCGITESIIHIHLQGSQENPPHGASGNLCCLAWQTGLTTSNIFSVLSREPSITFQSSTRAQAERIIATQYHMLYGGHWLPPSSGASGSSTCWVSCRLRQLTYLSSSGWHGRRSNRPCYILSSHGWPSGHGWDTAVIPLSPLGGALKELLWSQEHTTCDLASTLWCACAVP